jgi:uncharacterized protein YecE (DUF72 family)
MNFGKIENIKKVKFNLPEIPEHSLRKLNSLKSNAKAFVFSGCTAWNVKEWSGTYYPSNIKSTDYLREYSKQFNSIELNTTFYRIPDENTIDKWIDQTPDTFRFSPKIPKVISQNKTLGLNDIYLDMFCNVIYKLEKRLGLSFMQLPSNFKSDNIIILEKFLSKFPVKDIPLAIEFRHESWFQNDFPMRIFDLLSKYEVGTVMSDVAGRRDVLHMQIPTQFLMIRFVGNALDPTDFERMDNWISHLNLLIENGLNELYFFHHQENNLNAVDALSYFNLKMNENNQLDLLIPTNYNSSQLNLF